MTKKTLSTGKVVKIRKLSRIDIRNIKDKGQQRLFPDGTIGMVAAFVVMAFGINISFFIIIKRTD